MLDSVERDQALRGWDDDGIWFIADVLQESKTARALRDKKWNVLQCSVQDERCDLARLENVERAQALRGWDDDGICRETLRLSRSPWVPR